MLLYLGYLLIQAYPLIDKFFQPNMATSAIIFSIIVFFLWSFIPVSGYFVAKLLPNKIRGKGYLNRFGLFSAGALIALLENGLFHFNVLHYEQGLLNTFIFFTLFFVLSYISLGKPKKV